MRCPSEDVFIAMTRRGLSPQAAAEVERHLAVCSACRRLRAALAKADAAAPSGKEEPATLRPPHALSPGECASARYRVSGFIAKGGSGEVYRARDLALEQDIALKLLVCGHVGAAASERAMRHELSVGRRISHPNVCRLFDFGRVVLPGGAPRSWPFLTMELLEGSSLRARLQEVGRLSPAEAWPIAAQVARALDAIHAAGVVHRDLKGGNIILTKPRGAGRVRAVISDFGLAAPVSERSPSKTDVGLMVGTPTHIAPEQLEAKPLGPGADIFAFGVVLYEMVTGRLPFAGASPLLTALLRLREPPPAPHALAPQVPTRWSHAIMRCLERDPARRFARAADVVDALGGDPAALPARGAWWSPRFVSG